MGASTSLESLETQKAWIFILVLVDNRRYDNTGSFRRDLCVSGS